MGARFTADDIRASIEAATAEQGPFEVLARDFDDGDGEFLPAAAAYFGLRPISARELHAMQPDFSVISFVECSRRGCLALRAADRLVLAICDPLTTRDRTWLDAQLRAHGVADCDRALASRGDLRAVLQKHEKDVSAIETLGELAATGSAGADKAIAISLQDIDGDSSVVVRLVNSMIYDALKAQASDIHLETGPDSLVIRLRVDGVLATLRRIEGADMANQVISRIKIISELDIAERRVPQDGRFKVLAHGRGIDLRVSVMPSIHGEDAVLRILDRNQLSTRGGITLEGLGFAPHDIRFIRSMCRKPYGLLLVTGPTGSGKTTTMYAALSGIHTGLDKIVTIEDPVEYQLAGVLQIPVNEAKGLTFARGLRSILRHDPDKIMVGEIRDPETAQIAVQAALTGHQVFTTVHANNVFDVLGRFSNMGVDAYSFVSALNGILAQRLVRLNCPDCTVDGEPADEVLQDSGLDRTSIAGWRLRRGLGCATCRGSGFRGRKAIAEWLPMNDRMRDLIARPAPMAEIKAAAAALGVQTLRQAALALVRDGETTLEEINRVSMVD
ncbi:GspE/PulE family protein [Ramlibacter sp. MMS24-I3-19]|uniref:GspE/PulE family protein n=1 Tax=Ramlibacter sp. MMS24-I3-19 TaxID=3416606 RepID=UPI003D068D03